MKDYRASINKALRFLVIVGISVAVLAQFVGPAMENPSSDPTLSIRKCETIPPTLLLTLERSCFDCHSNESHWPWYSAITPLNYLIAQDINKGRKRLNFSEWKKNKSGKIQGWLQMIDDQVSLKEMPLPRYLYVHPGSSLSEKEIKSISQWASEEQARLSELASHNNDR